MVGVDPVLGCSPGIWLMRRIRPPTARQYAVSRDRERYGVVPTAIPGIVADIIVS
jgi:hypothetical protein